MLYWFGLYCRKCGCKVYYDELHKRFCGCAERSK